MTETQFNTPTFNDPEPCENEDCKDGFIYSNYWDYDTNESFPQKEKCPFCDDYGHKIK
jgi:hypothetical protein